VSAELAFQLSSSTISKFPELFSNLEQNMEKLSIRSYGISITTLEEVFLRVIEDKKPVK
jgi:ATP-binding cassette subfamily A (ABC1) protein 3